MSKHKLQSNLPVTIGNLRPAAGTICAANAISFKAYVLAPHLNRRNNITNTTEPYGTVLKINCMQRKCDKTQVLFCFLQM